MSEVYPAMIRRALALLQDPEEAQDVVQEVAARLWHDPKHLERAANRRAYCIMAVRNAAISVLRSARRFDNLEDAEHIPEVSATIEDAEVIDHIIDTLPSTQQTVLRLRIEEEMEYDMIAARMGLSVVNVRQLLSRARKELKKRYDQYK